MILFGTVESVLRANDTPDFRAAHIRAMKAHNPKSSLRIHEAAALYQLARMYNKHGCRILDIGVLWGYSTLLISEAAPAAAIIGINPAEHEYRIASDRLASVPNVKIECEASWDRLLRLPEEEFDMILVDGDHKRCALDIPWWNRIRSGGLMLFHDYDIATAKPVVEAVDALVKREGYDHLPISITDTEHVGRGLVGLWKR